MRPVINKNSAKTEQHDFKNITKLVIFLSKTRVKIFKTVRLNNIKQLGGS